jgi:hypothetical protein
MSFHVRARMTGARPPMKRVRPSRNIALRAGGDRRCQQSRKQYPPHWAMSWLPPKIIAFKTRIRPQFFEAHLRETRRHSGLVRSFHVAVIGTFRFITW